MHPVFTPVTLRTMTVKNRIARSATHDYVGNETGYVSDLQADIWEELAQNDLGLFITGHLYVDVLGQPERPGPRPLHPSAGERGQTGAAPRL